MDVIPFRSLPAETRQRVLAYCARARGAGAFYLLEYRPQRLWRAWAMATAAAAAASAVGLAIGTKLPEKRAAAAGLIVMCLNLLLAALVSLAYSAVVILELIRRRGSKLRPCVLITPLEVIRADYDHGNLVRWVLADAIELKRAQMMRRRKEYRGTAYRFTYSRGSTSLLLRDSGDVECLDAVLAQARAIKSDATARAVARARFELLPEHPPLVATNRPLTRPFSNFWRSAIRIYLLAAMGLLLLGAVLERYMAMHGR